MRAAGYDETIAFTSPNGALGKTRGHSVVPDVLRSLRMHREAPLLATLAHDTP
jgi:hypothetical protein